ncbi:Holliday junction resolvase RuvX [Roseateles sp. SL47]|jgi:putative holliday junction resolvase|uniref:Holliday junction resolvase RuvX n=1 Tax=Roseateles sp. SL47 TaxID=2995138 RepID=UPI00226EAD6C|nr:Holliday junction resolvase RuvX [Roseateles sp. SL47]WAC74897.1 Holliday junction resolvase RuvX [Roseateles sp. SL47]
MSEGRAVSVLGFDFGTKRIGVAIGNRLLGTARGLRTVTEQGDAKFAAITQLIKEWQPDALVVGVPRHPDGQPHDMTQRALKFAGQLRGRFRLAVIEVDERYTSAEAQAQGARDLDAASAALILEQYFREHP